MDWIEDQRALSHIETVFRNLLKRKIADLIHLAAIAARQIGKVTWCVLGDEDSSFFSLKSFIQTKVKPYKDLRVRRYLLLHSQRKRTSPYQLLSRYPWKIIPSSRPP
jgi:hypothetical protein